MTNRRLHVCFRLTPRSMALDDLELLQVRIFREFCAISRIWEATTAKIMKINSAFESTLNSPIVSYRLIGDSVVTHWMYFSTLCSLRWFAEDFTMCWILLPASLAFSNTRKFDGGLSRILHDELHWLDVTDRVQYSGSPCWCIDVFMEQRRCTWWTVAHKHPTSPVVNVCGLPVSGSWSFRVMVVARRCFAGAGPSTCRDLLPDSRPIHDLASSLMSQHFYFFAKYWRNVLSLLEIYFYEHALYKLTLYLLTYALCLEIRLLIFNRAFKIRLITL